MIITFNAVIIPIVITISLIVAAIVLGDRKDRGGGNFMGGISIIFYLVPALFISMISWIIWGVCK